MADKKNVNEEAMNQEEEQKVNTPETPADQKNDNAADQKNDKVRQFFKDHGKKIKAGAAAVGLIGAGIAADRLGIKFGSKKKGEETGNDTAAE